MAERSISRVIRGMTLRGTCCVRDGIVTVTTPFGSKSTQVIGGSKPASLAYITARELWRRRHHERHLVADAYRDNVACEPAALRRPGMTLNEMSETEH
jgi:hypothetical protein